MKKAFAYATLAAVLGIAVMLAPLIPSLTFSTSTSTQTGGEDKYERSLSPQSFGAIAKESESSAGIVPNYPVDAMTVMLMLLFSLAIAFVVSLYLRHSRFLKGVFHGAPAMAASSIRFTISSTVPSSLLCNPITKKDTPSKSMSEPMTLRCGNSILSFSAAPTVC